MVTYLVSSGLDLKVFVIQFFSQFRIYQIRLINNKVLGRVQGRLYPEIERLSEKEGIEDYFTYLGYSYHIRRMIYTTKINNKGYDDGNFL